MGCTSGVLHHTVPAHAQPPGKILLSIVLSYEIQLLLFSVVLFFFLLAVYSVSNHAMLCTINYYVLLILSTHMNVGCRNPNALHKYQGHVCCQRRTSQQHLRSDWVIRRRTVMDPNGEYIDVPNSQEKKARLSFR